VGPDFCNMNIRLLDFKLQDNNGTPEGKKNVWSPVKEDGRERKEKRGRHYRDTTFVPVVQKTTKREVTTNSWDWECHISQNPQNRKRSRTKGKKKLRIKRGRGMDRK